MSCSKSARANLQMTFRERLTAEGSGARMGLLWPIGARTGGVAFDHSLSGATRP